MKMFDGEMHTKVDEEVWEEFRDFVFRKHGKFRGKLGEEVTNALSTYLVLEGRKIEPQQHTRTDKKRRLRNIMERMIVRRWTNEVDKRSMERFIREEGIRDKRTVDEYFKALIDYGFIRHDRFSVYKVHPSKIPRVTA
jgi:hypothetical protein